MESNSEDASWQWGGNSVRCPWCHIELLSVLMRDNPHTMLETFVQQTERAHEDGHQVFVKPPMSAEQIVSLEQRCGVPIPADVRALVEYAAGVTIDGFEVDFGGEQAFEFEELLPGGVPIATDGFGNFWVVDVGEDGAWRRVLFVSHDPPIVAVQAGDMTGFLTQAVEGSVVEIARRFTGDVWERDPCLMSVEQAIASGDGALRAFAEQLGEGFSVVDLRAGEIGTGFVWSRGGPPGTVIRSERLLMFGIEKKKPGLLGRLFLRA